MQFEIKNVLLWENMDMKKFLGVFFICLLALVSVSLYYFNRWKPLWALDVPIEIYSVAHHQDDTLRIVMIGDSWVGMRTDSLSCVFQKRLSSITDRPVLLKTKGKGGEKSRGIYQLMFEEDRFGSKPLLLSGADYCIVFAGINDAAANLGQKQYVHYMNQIIDFLLANHIRPVLIEIPDVNIWNVYGKKPIKDLTVDYIRSLMTGCGMYHFSEYRDALKTMLKDSALNDSVLYVPMRGWNGDGEEFNRLLCLDDQIHLNPQGYIKMDSCIIESIRKDLKKFKDTTLFN